MTDTPDLMERLNSHMGKADIGEVLADCRLAAERLKALKAENARLREALEPFSKAAQAFASYADSVIISRQELRRANSLPNYYLTMRDLYAARQALQGEPKS